MEDTARNYTGQLPSDTLVDYNLAVVIIFSVLAPVLNGIVILPVFLLKQLRTKPYQYLTSNYLSSTLAIILEFGLYRGVQIIRYKIDGFETSAERTECGIVKFFEFPIVVSNFCLFVLGFERFLVLQYNRAIDRFVLILLIAFPWALGIYRQAFELTSSKTRYQNIPYSGLCVDVTSEQWGKEIATRLLDLIIPFILASVTISLAYAKAYSEWRVIDERLKLELYSDHDKKKELELQKKSVINIVRSINLAVAFFTLRIITTTFFRLLLRQVEEEESSQNLKDYAAASGVFFLLLETVINPIVFVIFNCDYCKALCNEIPLLRSSSVYPSSDGEVNDEVQDPENENTGTERPNTYALTEETNEENPTTSERPNTYALAEESNEGNATTS